MIHYFDKTKILAAAVVLLLILNFGILGFLWLGRPHKPGPEMMPMGSSDKMPHPERMERDRMPPPDRMPPNNGNPDVGPKEFIIHELGFNDNQKNDYRKLVEEHQADMKKLKDKMKSDRESLWSGFKNKADSSISFTSQIGEDQKQIELVTFRHFQKVRELCNDDQKKKFDDIINEVLKMMGPGGESRPKGK
ncbi:hypothetical protein BH10BAC5_BH10BAC5_20200 [soil metagenome]